MLHISSHPPRPPESPTATHAQESTTATMDDARARRTESGAVLGELMCACGGMCNGDVETARHIRTQGVQEHSHARGGVEEQHMKTVTQQSRAFDWRNGKARAQQHGTRRVHVPRATDGRQCARLCCTRIRARGHLPTLQSARAMAPSRHD